MAVTGSLNTKTMSIKQLVEDIEWLEMHLECIPSKLGNLTHEQLIDLYKERAQACAQAAHSL